MGFSIGVKLMKNTSLTFSVDTGVGGYLDANNDWVQGTATTVVLEGSLQPIETQSNSQVKTMHGFKSGDVLLFCTQDANGSQLKTADQFGKNLASTTTIKNTTYFVYGTGDWTTHGLDTDHYAFILYREDLDAEGVV